LQLFAVKQHFPPKITCNRSVTICILELNTLSSEKTLQNVRHLLLVVKVATQLLFYRAPARKKN